MMFYDEFPLNPAVPGLGGGAFNGSQEYAFNKNALESGFPPRFPMESQILSSLSPARTWVCCRRRTGPVLAAAGVDCWAAAIPAQPPDPTQYDNSHGGSGFMLDSLDFPGFAGLPTAGDNRIAVFDWTGLKNLNSPGCITCRGIRFGGQLFSGVLHYVQQSTPDQYPSGVLGAQKAGPIPLGDECGAAGLSVGSPPPASCPENGIATNGDNMTQVSQAQGQLWGGTSTEIDQTFSSESKPELHQGAVYFVVGTGTFDKYGVFSLTSQGYVSPEP